MKKFLFVIFLSLFFCPTFVRAVDFSWQRSDDRVCLFLNTGDVSVNAVSGKIFFENLSAVGFSEANSVVNFWLKKPDVSGGEIEGVIPGGFAGEMGQLGCFTLGSVSDSSFVSLSDAKVFLNDGNGTEVSVNSVKARISDEQDTPISAPTSTVNLVQKNDAYPPEDFSPLIATEAEMYSGQKFIVFATEDKNSGMDHYEILESDFAWRQKNGTIRPLSVGKWKIVESPYVLRDQDLKSYVFVRAIDRMGNVREVVMEPTVIVKWYERGFVVIGLGIFALIIFSVGYFIKRRK
ncbi:MAG TPA: hypothetical protein PLV72_03375 [Candidatus Magasanikbacteria bacterium]|nr:hypothetical protein [Candidatus Magasanikbacteria bacterium]